MSSRFITEDDLKKILESLQVGEPIDFISLQASNILNLSTTFQVLPYNTIRSQVSNGGFTHNGQGGIICNKQGHVEISGSYYYQGTQGVLYYLYTYKNGEFVGGVAERAAASSDTVSLSSFIISVAPGDIINFQGKTNTGTGVFAQGGLGISTATLRYINGSTYNTNSIYNFNIDMIYPVGSIYMSVNNVSPETFMSGTVWESLTNRFLIGAGDSYGKEAKGGQTSVSYTPAGTVGNHTLTVDQMPSHIHAMRYTVSSGGTAGQGWNYSNTRYGTSSATEASALMKAQGGGKAHNHGFTGTAATITTMPPYLAVYMWKRVA